jgi:hypothetical protein
MLFQFWLWFGGTVILFSLWEVKFSGKWKYYRFEVMLWLFMVPVFLIAELLHLYLFPQWSEKQTTKCGLILMTTVATVWIIRNLFMAWKKQKNPS